ncbi:PAS domain S-box [Desulfocapsa sulfexigens DSM 10523]|uniref:histidine kinase n=1 Tax=Desulfocapsa sulfexigens (strain DSM 10523 / SB164P1) TaxID=1167006 RepID=M1P762_DESSD|nr:ATP-binding protein [Desulfocapsa sulfexigens]AGF79318.1 PAS domain S-box [Desulfocapsa sulfexigens DSM 10523]
MKIRSIIFLIVIALGLFPVLFLVALNLPKTMERLEYAAELETQARSQVGFTQLNARILCLKKSLIRSATLPSVYAAIEDSSGIPTLSNVVKRWFENDEQVKGMMLFNADGVELLSLHRKNSHFAPSDFSENHKDHLFFNQSLQVPDDQVLVRLVDQETDPFHRTGKEEYELIMSTPVILDSAVGAIGIMLMRIDMSHFLTNFTDSYWVTGDGNYVRGCVADSESSDRDSGEISDSCNAFDEFPDLNRSVSRDPIILSGNDKRKIAWVPLVFNKEHHVVMWVGTLIDDSAIKKWKMTLTVNVIVLIVVMTILVFIAANWISAKIEILQRDLLTRLDDIINKEKRIDFHWGGPLELQNLSRDLTAFSERYSLTCEARNLAEASLSESEDKFRSLTGSALDGIILMDNEGYITYWNEAAATIFGYSPEEALQHPIHSLINPRREGEDLSVEPLETGKSAESLSQTVELIARNEKGDDVYVELSLSSTTIKGKWHAIWIVRDISERKRSEDETRKQQQQLLHADKMISLGLLVSGVAHEINNPNSIALLNTPILFRAWESAKPILDEFFEENGDFSIAGLDYREMRQQLPRIFLELEESAQRIKQIVMDLKDYARQETSGQLVPVDITEVVKSGIRLTSNTIHKSTNKFITHFSPTPLMVLGNRQRLTQVVINLIQNSCEALETTDMSLTISTRYNKEVDGVEISIKDEGTGIAPENLKQVTDPFFTTKRSIGGTGLGLSVSAGIVKEHHGVMDFKSEFGKGTEVVIVFPACPAESKEN